MTRRDRVFDDSEEPAGLRRQEFRDRRRRELLLAAEEQELAHARALAAVGGVAQTSPPSVPAGPVGPVMLGEWRDGVGVLHVEFLDGDGRKRTKTVREM